MILYKNKNKNKRGGNPLFLETLEPLDLWSPCTFEAEIVLCWGTQRHGVSAWGVARLLGAVRLLGNLETS